MNRERTSPLSILESCYLLNCLSESSTSMGIRDHRGVWAMSSLSNWCTPCQRGVHTPRERSLVLADKRR